jgi:hypothetical protein
MNQIKKEELFGNLKVFLKSRGIELQEGAYTERIRQGCSVLADSVNLSQRAWGNAKEAVDKSLDRMRQAIHERTAPQPSTGGSAGPKAKGTRRSASSQRASSRPAAAASKSKTRPKRRPSK